MRIELIDPEDTETQDALHAALVDIYQRSEVICNVIPGMAVHPSRDEITKYCAREEEPMVICHWGQQIVGGATLTTEGKLTGIWCAQARYEQFANDLAAFSLGEYGDCYAEMPASVLLMFFADNSDHNPGLKQQLINAEDKVVRYNIRNMGGHYRAYISNARPKRRQR